MTNSKKTYYRGGFQYELFNDDEYQSIDKISRQVVLDALSPFLQRIMQALDRACEKIDQMYNDNPCAFALMSNYLPLAINAEFCSNLSLIQGFRVTKVKNNAISIEVEGMKMRFWLRKFPNGKHTLRPNSRRTYLKLRGKTDDADTRPLIILGYTSTRDKLKYTGLFFTQQRNQEYLDWQIDIVEECLKQQKSITSAVSMVADDSDDIPMTIKESALLKSIIDK
jgi:hypothetical protein